MGHFFFYSVVKCSDLLNKVLWLLKCLCTRSHIDVKDCSKKRKKNVFLVSSSLFDAVRGRISSLRSQMNRSWYFLCLSPYQQVQDSGVFDAVQCVTQERWHISDDNYLLKTVLFKGAPLRQAGHCLKRLTINGSLTWDDKNIKVSC